MYRYFLTPLLFIYFIQIEYTKLTHPQRAYSPSLLRYRVMQCSTDSSLPVETKGRKKADKKSMVDNLVPREPRSRASLMCCIANKDWLKLRNKGLSTLTLQLNLFFLLFHLLALTLRQLLSRDWFFIWGAACCSFTVFYALHHQNPVVLHLFSPLTFKETERSRRKERKWMTCSALLFFSIILHRPFTCLGSGRFLKCFWKKSLMLPMSAFIW